MSYRGNNNRNNNNYGARPYHSYRDNRNRNRGGGRNRGRYYKDSGYQGKMESKEELRMKQKALPVFSFKERILKTVKENPIVLIVGETGSGKTTQIPQYLFECDFVSANNRIICTQPRKVAATSVAERVAYEHDYSKFTVGETIGYQVRLKTRVSDATKLVYMTEGILLRKAMGARNRNFKGFSIVIVDEAHERTVNADLLMGFLKKMVRTQQQIPMDERLHVIIMSATLDTHRFLKYFNNPPLIEIPGKVFPIQHHFLSKPTEDYIKSTIMVVREVHLCSHSKPGHILVFLTGMQDIDNVCSALNAMHLDNLIVFPLYSSLPPCEQNKAFSDVGAGNRKCVVATNIAETSLTIEGVVYVVDCGLSKQKVYSSAKGVEALAVRAISKASVKQRIGRAGRTCAGIAYHLYTKLGYKEFSNETRAEILRSGLVSETLNMLALGIDNPLKFDYIDSPDEMTLGRALYTLKILNAIDNNGKITDEGRAMAHFPLDPRLAKCILNSIKYKCVYEMIVIAAMLECKDKLWRKPRDGKRNDEFKRCKRYFDHISGDHLTLLNIYNAYKSVKCCETGNSRNETSMRNYCEQYFLDYRSLNRVEQIKGQLERILVELQISERKNNNDNNDNNNDSDDNKPSPVIFEIQHYLHEDYYNNIILTLITGYFMNVAVLGFGGKYWLYRVLPLSANDCAIDVIDKASPHQSSSFHKNLKRNWVIFHEVIINQLTVLKCITAAQPSWLLKIASHYFCPKKLRLDRSPIAKCFIQLDEGIIPEEDDVPLQPSKDFVLKNVGLCIEDDYGNKNNNNNNSNKK